MYILKHMAVIMWTGYLRQLLTLLIPLSAWTAVPNLKEYFVAVQKELVVIVFCFIFNLYFIAFQPSPTMLFPNIL